MVEMFILIEEEGKGDNGHEEGEVGDEGLTGRIGLGQGWFQKTG